MSVYKNRLKVVSSLTLNEITDPFLKLVPWNFVSDQKQTKLRVKVGFFTLRGRFLVGIFFQIGMFLVGF